MTIMYLKQPYLSVNSVDLSAYVTEETITYEAADLDTTAGNSLGTTSHLAGLKSWSIDVTFNQDYAAAQVDATLWPLVGAASFAIETRTSTAVVGVTNPKWTGSALLLSYSPITGKVGDLITTKITLTGTGDLTRAVA